MHSVTRGYGRQRGPAQSKNGPGLPHVYEAICFVGPSHRYPKAGLKRCFCLPGVCPPVHFRPNQEQTPLIGAAGGHGRGRKRSPFDSRKEKNAGPSAPRMGAGGLVVPSVAISQQAQRHGLNNRSTRTNVLHLTPAIKGHMIPASAPTDTQMGVSEARMKRGDPVAISQQRSLFVFVFKTLKRSEYFSRIYLCFSRINAFPLLVRSFFYLSNS